MTQPWRCMQSFLFDLELGAWTTQSRWGYSKGQKTSIAIKILGSAYE